MKLEEILNGINVIEIKGDVATEISGIIPMTTSILRNIMNKQSRNSKAYLIKR